MTTTADPVSETLDRAARQLLDRVYAARGGWAVTRLASPTPEQAGYWLFQGVPVWGPDPVHRQNPDGLDARSRWMRAYIRALWRQHQFWSGDPDTGGWRAQRRTTRRPDGIQIRVGRLMPVRGIIPAGREIRVRMSDIPKGSPVPAGRQWASGGPAASDATVRDWPGAYR